MGRAPRFLRPLGNETITRLRADLVEDSIDHSMNRDWGNASQLTIEKCEVQPFILSSRLAFEQNVGREHEYGSTRFWCPIEDILYTDRIIWHGIEFEVLGHPMPWNYTDGTFAYLSFLGKEREG